MSYVVAIKTAVFTFPVVSLFFTFPYMLKQYHKYGSINKFRTLIVYSFILYLISIYFLVILPLPRINEVKGPLEDMIRLVPFSFVGDFIRETSFRIDDASTIFKALTEPCFYTVFFNLLMTVPFGMYMRYYFKKDLKETFLLTLYLSLFFELTQLTGLYFIYPYPYRIFDVDDLIINTTGGILGFFICGLFKKILPSRQKIDEDSIRDGMVVSGMRRVTMFSLDIILFLCLTLIVKTIFKGIHYLDFAMFIIYYAVIPFYKETTLAGKFLNVKLKVANKFVLRNFLRAFLIYCYYFFLPYFMFRLSVFLVVYFDLSARLSIEIYFGIFALVGLFYLINFISVLKNKRKFYDKISGVEYESTILQ